MTDHLITIPEELIDLWVSQFNSHTDEEVFTNIAQWAADQELEACCEWLASLPNNWTSTALKRVSDLRAVRRPKPPSLKEQALAALKRQRTRSVPSMVSFEDCETIRRALEQLDD
jgi:hypothetical protein